MSGTRAVPLRARRRDAHRTALDVVFQIVTLPAVVSRANEADELRPSDTRVLVVDDAPANLSLLKQLLTRDGYSVLTARDGVDALAIVEREAPDIVLTDVVMPRRDGVDLCRAIKANPAEAPHGSS
jgi:two-component system capsular synthesis sensor histidine kinase RcsC